MCENLWVISQKDLKKNVDKHGQTVRIPSLVFTMNMSGHALTHCATVLRAGRHENND
jgi:hypothetical protein